MLGPFTVGDGARIGSNAVVVKEVPPGVTVVGIPARPTGPQPVPDEAFCFSPYGTTPGSMALDPVTRSLERLTERVRELEDRRSRPSRSASRCERPPTAREVMRAGDPGRTPRSVYLDHAAASPVRPEVAAAMAEVLLTPGNPASPHGPADMRASCWSARAAPIAERMGVAPDRVVFTSGGTEANGLALLGFPGPKLVGATEHASVLEVVPDARRIPVDGRRRDRPRRAGAPAGGASGRRSSR